MHTYPAAPVMMAFFPESRPNIVRFDVDVLDVRCELRQESSCVYVCTNRREFGNDVVMEESTLDDNEDILQACDLN